MRIHTDKLEASAILKALPHGVTAARVTAHGSRKRDYAFELQLHGTSSSRTQSGSGKAATWDEWGIVLAALFAADPDMVAQYYPTADEFHWQTGDRFRTGALTDPADQHRRHDFHLTGHSAGGSYSVYTCKCGAITRSMRPGHTFAEIA